MVTCLIENPRLLKFCLQYLLCKVNVKVQYLSSHLCSAILLLIWIEAPFYPGKTIVQLVRTIVNWTRDHGVFGIRLIHEKKTTGPYSDETLNTYTSVMKKTYTRSIQNICEMSTSMLPACLPGQESCRTVEFISLKTEQKHSGRSSKTTEFI